MQTISFEVVDQAWDKFCDWTEEHTETRVKEISDVQPLLMVYLMAVGEDVFSDDEQESLFSLGVFVWHLLDEHGCKAEVTETILDEVEGGYAELLEELNDLPVEVYSERLNQQVNSHSQAPLMNYLLDVLGNDVDEEMISDENAGMMFTILQVVIDTLVKAKAD